MRRWIRQQPEWKWICISVQTLFVSGKFQKQFRNEQRTGDDEMAERWESIDNK